MIIAIVFLVIIILSHMLYKNKLLYIVSILFMWIIMTFAHGNADEELYLNRYNNPNLWENQTE